MCEYRPSANRCLNACQAHRAMISSAVAPNPRPSQPNIDLTSLNINVPPVPPPVAALNPGHPGRDRETQLVRRVRELEEEVRTLKVENEKQVRPHVSSTTYPLLMTAYVYRKR